MLLASFTLQHRVVPYEAMGVFWGLGFAIALIVAGLEASRPLLAGGLVMLAACIATEALVHVQDARGAVRPLDLASEPEDRFRMPGEKVIQGPRYPSIRRPATS